MLLDAKTTVAELARTMLGDSFGKYLPPTEPRKAFRAVIHATYVSPCEDGAYRDVREFVHVVVTQCREVFYATSKQPDAAIEDFAFVSAHESCWKNMEFFHEVFMRLATEADSETAPASERAGTRVRRHPVRSEG